MPARSIVWIDGLLILLQIHEGCTKTYADESYGRIRGKNPTTGVSAGVVFLIVFGCLVGGFFACCISGTLVLEAYDYVVGYIQQKRSTKARIKSFSTSLVTHL